MDSILLKIQNPWWENNDAIGHDPHLVKIIGKPYFYHHPVVNSQVFLPQDLHIVRGPRQVGKPTLLNNGLRNFFS